MRAPRFESSRTSALASSTSSRRSPSSFLRCNDFSPSGIGLLTATAIVGFVGDLRRFPSGRRFSSYLGLVPKENSSGDIRRLGSITKRGDSYLRTLLTQGGRAVLRAANVSKSPPDKLRAWARKVHRSRGHNKAAIAVANKLARIVWAVSTRESEFQSVPAAA